MFFLYYFISNKTQPEGRSICVVLSKQIKRQQEILKEQSDGDTGNIGEVLSNVCEGLTRMLSALYCHTSSHVMSSTMAKKTQDGRFSFSHDFHSLPPKYLIQWIDNQEHLEF